MPTTKYDAARALARNAARRMLEAEVDLGEAVTLIGIEHADRLARDLGVRRSVVLNAAMQARGLVKRHRPLERAAARRRKVS